MRQRVLVLGASGFIGRRLASILASRRIGIVAVSRCLQQLDDARVRSRVCDFRSPELAVAALGDMDSVVQAATASTPAFEIDENLRTPASHLTALRALPHVRAGLQATWEWMKQH